MEPPRLLTACSALPLAGAAAPAVWQSQYRGPRLHEEELPPANALTFFKLWH